MSLLNELIDYSNDVVSGKQIACIKHRWACQRFLNDLDKQGTEEFPFVFSEDKANHFLNWMRLFKHTKGPLAKTYIEPHIIQKFNFGNLFGWIHKDTKFRRFRKSYWQVARKNAKSQSESCMGTYETFADDESASEVYCGATKTKQAKIVWNEAKLQLNQCSMLQGKYRTANGLITHLKSESYMAYLSKEDGKSGDGFNPQCGIIDEYHAHPTSEIYDIIVSGMGARVQPLMTIITTAGFDLSHPCFAEYKYVSRILNPADPTTNEEYFVMINELDKDDEGHLIDDIKDEKTWIKANPIVAENQTGIKYLRGELKIALDMPEKMKNFLTKNMDIWVQMKDGGYMNLDKWNKCGQTLNAKTGLYELNKFGLEITKDRECVNGNDLSAVLDLTSTSFEFKIDGKYYVFSHSFMPEDKLAEKINMDKMPYDLWAKQGWITLTPGAVVDYDFVMAYIEEQEKKYGFIIKELCYDKWNANQFGTIMTNRGYTCVDIRQGMQTLGEPTSDFRKEVYQGNIIHNNNPVLTWAIGNAVTKMAPNETFMLDKSKCTQRIDPIASLINAHVRAMGTKEQSVYEKRGMRSLL